MTDIEKKVAVLEKSESFLRSDNKTLKDDVREITHEMKGLFRDAAKMTTAVDQLRFVMKNYGNIEVNKKLGDGENG